MTIERHSLSGRLKPWHAHADRLWWGLWALAMALFLVMTLPVLEAWPTLFQDEMQIIDYGRVFLEPATDWSTGWLVHESMALRSLAFIGATLQELAYQAGLPGWSGGRFSAVVGAVLASGLAFGWLMSRGTPVFPAFVLCLAFLLDPFFHESYRQGRVDSWALSVCIAACWLLRSAAAIPPITKGLRGKTLLAGALTVVAFFVWPTSAALAPLIGVELLHQLRAGPDDHGRQGSNRAISVMAAFAVGAIVAAALCLIPFVLHLDAALISFDQGVRVQQAATIIERSIVDLYAVHNPWLLPALLLSVVLHRDWLLLAALAVAVLMMLQTMVYEMRLLYLLPYFIAVIAAATASVAVKIHAPRRKTLMVVGLAIMIGGNGAVALVERTLLPLRGSGADVARPFEPALREAIGEGPFRVLTTEWEVYFAARSLGWKLYYPFGSIDKRDKSYGEFLRSMDFAITREGFQFAKPVRLGEFEQAGFVRQADISLGDRPADASTQAPAPAGAQSGTALYPDLLIYRNTKPEQAR